MRCAASAGGARLPTVHPITRALHSNAGLGCRTTYEVSRLAADRSKSQAGIRLAAAEPFAASIIRVARREAHAEAAAPMIFCIRDRASGWYMTHNPFRRETGGFEFVKSKVFALPVIAEGRDAEKQ